jgi:hypothetical protein
LVAKEAFENIPVPVNGTQEEHNQSELRYLSDLAKLSPELIQAFFIQIKNTFDEQD